MGIGIVITQTSVYRLTANHQGNRIKAEKLDAYAPSAIRPGEAFTGDRLILALGEPMRLGGLRTSPVVAILPDTAPIPAR